MGLYEDCPVWKRLKQGQLRIAPLPSSRHHSFWKRSLGIGAEPLPTCRGLPEGSLTSPSPLLWRLHTVPSSGRVRNDTGAECSPDNTPGPTRERKEACCPSPLRLCPCPAFTLTHLPFLPGTHHSPQGGQLWDLQGPPRSARVQVLDRAALDWRHGFLSSEFLALCRSEIYLIWIKLT